MSVLVKPLIFLYNCNVQKELHVRIPTHGLEAYMNHSMSFLVDLFLDEISECFGKDAVLLTLTPKTIGGKNVKDLFTEYVPRKSRFVEVLIILVRDLELLHV